MTFNDLTKYLTENITRASESEIRYYIEEIFGTGATDIQFIEREQKLDNPKFDAVITTFVYNNQYFVKVFSSAGENASKSNNGSLTVSVFVYDYDRVARKPSKEQVKREHNAFYNKSSGSVNYDPVIRNGEDLVKYVKSVLNDDNDDPSPPLPKNSSPQKIKQLA
jgi:hypothetical protein